MQGHIHKRVRTDRHGKETVRWYVVVDLGFDHEGRRRQKWHGGFRTRREAEAARAKLVTELNTGSYVVPGRTTLEEWIRDSWLPMTEPRVKPTTFHSYKRNLELHVLPALGRKPLQQLTPPMLNVALRPAGARLRDERKPLSAKTISYIHATLHKVLADAVDAGLLGRNVAAGAKPPRPSAAGDRRHQRLGAGRARRVPRRPSAARGSRPIWRLVRHDRDAARRGPRAAVAGPRPRPRPALGPAGARRSRLRGHPLDAEEPQRPRDRPRRRDGRAAASAPAAPGRGAGRVGRRLPGPGPRRRQGERRADPSAHVQPVVRAADREAPTSGRSGSTTSATRTRRSR